MEVNTKTNHPGPESIDQWKKKFGEVYEIEIEAYKCWLRAPDIKTFKHAFTSLQLSEIDFQNAIINNCWLEGDAIIREDEDYFNALCGKIDDLIEIPDYQIRRNGEVFNINIKAFSCELRKPKREDIRVAQMQNLRNQAFETNINLLNRIWIKGDEELKEKPNYYIALLLAVSELETQKVATIKKL